VRRRGPLRCGGSRVAASLAASQAVVFTLHIGQPDYGPSVVPATATAWPAVPILGEGPHQLFVRAAVSTLPTAVPVSEEREDPLR
jgi:hypothetical protein